MKRIILDSDDFEKLTAGKIVSKDGIKIILSDIGWHNMIGIITNNLKKTNGT